MSGLYYIGPGQHCSLVDGYWHVAVDHPDGAITIRQRYPGESLGSAFRLVYEVYVVEQGLIAAEALPQGMTLTRMKWDDWDHSPDTTHLLAFHQGSVIGQVRLINDGPRGLPIERNGFSLSGERRRHGSLQEMSKLIIAPNFRASRIAGSFYWLAYQLAHVQAGRRAVYFSCDPALRMLYRRMGAVDIGAFFNAEFGKPYSAMRNDFVETFELQCRGGLLANAAKRTVPTLALTMDKITTVLAATGPIEPVQAWTAEIMNGGGAGPETSCAWRIKTALVGDSDRVRHWSCVAKSLFNKAPAIRQGEGPAWDQEARVYEGGVTGLLPGITTPRVFSCERSANTVTLFMEDLARSCIQPITPADVPMVAYRLGAWQAIKNGDDRAISGWLRWYVEAAAPVVDAIPTIAASVDLLAPLSESGDLAEVQEVWRQRHALLNELQNMRQVISHGDLVARNIFKRGNACTPEEFVFIDWSHYQHAAIGSDLAALIVGSSLLFEWSVEHAVELIPVAIDSYVEGLRASGTTVERNEVFRGFALTSALRYIAWVGHRIEAAVDRSMHAWAESAAGKPLAEVVDRYIQIRKMIISNVSLVASG